MRPMDPRHAQIHALVQDTLMAQIHTEQAGALCGICAKPIAVGRILVSADMTLHVCIDCEQLGAMLLRGDNREQLVLIMESPVAEPQGGKS